MSAILHPNAKKTHGHALPKDGSELRPSDSLIDRNQQWKHITKSLLHTFEGLSSIEAATAKSTHALVAGIQVPFHEGHQFLGEGGWQASLYTVRDQLKILGDHHAALATTLDKTVVKELEGVRADLKAHIAAIEKEAGVLATEVDKERATSASHLTQLQTGIDTFEHSSDHMLPQHDPYLTHIQVSNQLTKQVHKENDLQAALIRFQQQQPSFEEGISKSIQSACKMFEEAKEVKAKEIAATEKAIAEALQTVTPTAEYEHYKSKAADLIDPNTPFRSVDAVTFPGLNHAATTTIKEGPLERKKRFTKSYKESYYVLTPSGYLHERKSNDESDEKTPGFSLFLPECALSTPSKETDKSHKFHLEGNKAVKSSFESKVKNSLRFGGKEIAYTFRARTHAEMMLWWEQMDKISRETKREQVNRPKSTAISPVAAAVANVGYPVEDSAAAAKPIDPAVANLTPEEAAAKKEKADAVKSAGVESTANGNTATPAAAEEEDDEERGGSSAEEEDEAERTRTAPTTPAAGLIAQKDPLSGEAASAAKGTAEVLPTYQGDGVQTAEKGGLLEKGYAPALGEPSASTSS